MTEAPGKAPRISGFSRALTAWRDPAARIFNIDLLTVLIAIVLPWSTSGVAIAVALWLIALAPTIEPRLFLRSLARPVSALPIALCVLAVAGTLWSDASWGARLYAVGPTAKLLVLPLLLYHFERSSRGAWVFVAFLASCTLLMVVSWAVFVIPDLSLKAQVSDGLYTPNKGIFVKNYIDQSQEFALCAVALAYPVLVFVRTRKIWLAALLGVIALSFIVNMAFVIVSRTALATIPIMLGVFGLLHLRWRNIVIILGALAVFAGLAWQASPQLRWTTETFLRDYRLYKQANVPTSIGIRLEFWQKSLRFFAEAPVVGHGTGSTRGLFEQAAIGKSGAAAEVVGNPHNQTLNVAVQWGTIGVVVLYAMWLCHLLLFRGDSLATWIGLLVVVQNFFTSLFNSHLFDFHEGWMYVLGVGVAGGMALGTRRAPIQGVQAGDRTRST